MRTWMVMCILLGIISAGCGGRGPKIATVRGTVTLDGEPLPYAAVVFNPENGRPAGATTDEDGNYTLNFTEGRQGALLGTHRVVITTRRDPWKDKQGKPQPGSKEKLPAKYNSNSILTFTVEPATENIADFELESSGTDALTSEKN